MNSAYQSIQLHELPEDLLVEGYYWYSNEKSPKVITSETIQRSWFAEMPFVIEANFYAKAEQISFQIRNIDGAYHVAKIDLNHLDVITHDKTTYIGHDLGGRNFQIIEAWAPQPDDFLEGMETLVPAWAAFAGFINPNDK